MTVNRLAISSDGTTITVSYLEVIGQPPVPSVLQRGDDLVGLVKQLFASSARILRDEVTAVLTKLANGERGRVVLDYESATAPNIMLET